MTVVAVALTATSCSSDDDFVARYGDPQFRWGFGLDGPEQLLEILVTSYHLSSTDADCVTEAIFVPGFGQDRSYGATHTVTSDALDRAVEACHVDTNTIWAHTD